MSDNDREILGQILSEKKTLAPEWTDSEYFELFGARQILTDFPLDNEEIESGLVGDSTDSKGKGSDGGIDGFYVLVNGKLIRNPSEATSLKQYKQNITLDVVIMQATLEPSFNIARINRLSDTMTEVLDLKRQPKDFTETLNPLLLNAVSTFRIAHSMLLLRGFTFVLSYLYLSRGDKPAADNLLQKKARELESATEARLTTIKKCNFQFLGAAELVKTAITPPKAKFVIECATQPMVPKDGGLVGLVKLRDYFKFITHEETGDLLDHLFDSNVRDYQGDVEVNREIRESLQRAGGDEEFWWLNNGITILASKAENAQGDMVVHDPQIVNGLQTSMEIFNHFKAANGHPTTSSEKKLLIRVIGSQDIGVQDRVIKATNSQTGISPASIWATDPIQRDIETIFKKSDLYYDRRKNYWRNRGIPLAQIIGISELAQAVGAIFLQDPHNARGKPARYFKSKGPDKELYGKVFNPAYPIAFYPACAHLKIAVAAFLRKAQGDRRIRQNLLYHVLMVAASKLTQMPAPSVQKLASMKPSHMKDALFQEAWNVVWPIFSKMGSTDKAAKGPALTEKIKTALTAS